MAEVKDPKQAQPSQSQGRQVQEQDRDTSSGKQLRQHSSLTPFEEMNRMMDRVFEGMLPRSWMHPFSLGLERPALSGLAQSFNWQAPKVDVINRDDDILVRAEVPGVEKDDLHLSVTENTLTIHGQSRHEEKTHEGEYFRQELTRGSFSRTLNLPSQVDGSKAKAQFKNGILELTLPKLEKSQRHSIQIE